MAKIETIVISAEVEPLPSKADAAALALQRLGFRVLNIGLTISVEGPKRLWESGFNVSFKRRKKTIIRGVKGGKAVYYEAQTDSLHIPEELRTLIGAVMFLEPPEFHE
jgi:hypothetical protein